MRNPTIALLLLLAASPAAAQLPVPAGLAPGDTYQLVFNSSQFRTGLSSNIASYNNFVQQVADDAGLGGSEGITWKAIASTASIDARVNAVVGGNTSVYNMRAAGLEKIADGFNDMWDGGLDSFPAYDEFGQVNTVDAWTGSTPAGLRASATGSTLGHVSGTAWCGRPGFRDSRWIQFFEPSTSISLSVYGLSQIITVTDADFNQDGDVSGDDFLRWQRGKGSAGTLATGDANGDQAVNAADLAIWERAYGDGVPATAVVASVPEPGGVILLLAAIVTTSGRTVRRR
ncbi:hypothetical protein OAS39_08950 [Pirellulales bacterium]|nr:hypothetical protein [Pirellulales bacterium]